MNKPGYQLTQDKSGLKIRFAFISRGSQHIIKLIDYDYAGLYNDTSTFNLAFGDYDYKTGQIDDQANTANGDAYQVLNTVLNSIPLFFKEYPRHALMIRGSDSGAAFTKKCIAGCKKKCKAAIVCKNQNRRINLYNNYVNINYDLLVSEYDFTGGHEHTVEPFLRNKKYDTIFLLKKHKFVI